MKKFYFCLCVAVVLSTPLAAQHKGYLITKQELEKLENTYLSLGKLNQEQRKQMRSLADTLKLSRMQSALLMVSLREARQTHETLTNRLGKERILLAKLRASSRAFEQEATAKIEAQARENSALRSKLRIRTVMLSLIVVANITAICAFVAKKCKFLPFLW
ncbi:MAG: hypothetical protein ACTTI3_08425 [Treponema sp.]